MGSASHGKTLEMSVVSEMDRAAASARLALDQVMPR
jgi:hypothetical protein